MSDLADQQAKPDEQVWHLHVDADGNARSHCHSSDAPTQAQRDFQVALEAFLKRWGLIPKGEPSW